MPVPRAKPAKIATAKIIKFSRYCVIPDQAKFAEMRKTSLKNARISPEAFYQGIHRNSRQMASAEQFDYSDEYDETVEMIL